MRQEHQDEKYGIENMRGENIEDAKILVPYKINA